MLLVQLQSGSFATIKIALSFFLQRAERTIPECTHHVLLHIAQTHRVLIHIAQTHRVLIHITQTHSVCIQNIRTRKLLIHNVNVQGLR